MKYQIIRSSSLIGLLLLSILLPLAAQKDSVIIPERTSCEFPGGVDSLYRCLEQKFLISRTELQFEQYQDLVGDVKLTINKKGEVISVNSGYTKIEYELERAFMSLPPFIPATVKGNPVTSYVELKFMFMVKGNRMEVTEHLMYHTSARDKDTSWLKAALVAGSVVIFLILWGI